MLNKVVSYKNVALLSFVLMFTMGTIIWACDDEGGGGDDDDQCGAYCDNGPAADCQGNQVNETGTFVGCSKVLWRDACQGSCVYCSGTSPIPVCRKGGGGTCEVSTHSTPCGCEYRIPCTGLWSEGCACNGIATPTYKTCNVHMCY